MFLALNVGSSSLKAAVFDLRDGAERRVHAATVRAAGEQSVVSVVAPDGSKSEGRVARLGVAAAVTRVLEGLERDGLAPQISAVGHRIVHGGERYRQPAWLTPSVIDALRDLIPLAPDHLPPELDAIGAVANRWPHTRQGACFDTAFHADLPNRARLFGIPRSISDSGVVRFGFHGLSYEYVVQALRTASTLGARTVIAHLGSGASLAAIAEGRSVDTTMGFTPTGGVVMASRSGDLDPGVLLYLARTMGRTVDDLSRIVNVEGGLVGISGTTGDMQSLLERRAADPRGALAVDVFCYQVSKAIAAMATALGGLDTLVFTGGIGEHAAQVRAIVCERVAWCGVALDEPLNATHAPVISRGGAPVAVRIVPTNEELMIARHLRALLDGETDVAS